MRPIADQQQFPFAVVETASKRVKKEVLVLHAQTLPLATSTNVVGTLSQKEALKQSRLKIAASAIRKLNASQTGSLGLGPLADLSVSLPTLRDYLQRVTAFWDYVDLEDLETGTPEEVDMALAKYLTFLWQEVGELAHEGEKTKAGFEAAYPQYGRQGRFGLPVTHRTLIGFRKCAPQGQRHPLPEEAMDLMCERFEKRGLCEEILCVQTMFSSYMRPGEGMCLTVGGIVQPVVTSSVSMRHYTIILRPLEQLLPTKTGGFDETITLDDVRAPWLGQALFKQSQNRLGVLISSGYTREQALIQPLWSFTQRHLLKQMKAALSDLQLSWMGQTLYLLRHGGASRDVALSLRSLPDVMRRGRWAHIESVRHYEKHGRLQSILQRMGASRVAQAHAFRRRLASVLLV